MNRTVKIYLFVLILLFIGAVIIEQSKPRPIDWTKTYNETHKIPFGTYIFFNELANLFPGATISELEETPYEFFDSKYDWEAENYLISGTYMYVDEYMSIDEVSAEELLNFVSYGNDAFISSSYLPDNLKDSLGIELNNTYDFQGKADLSFSNPRLTSDSITIDRGLNNIHFSKLDSSRTTVLGYQKFSKEQKINFIKIHHGSGWFYLHLQPAVFTNYNLLKANKARYASAVLSYLQDIDIFFDSRNKNRNLLSQSPMRFVLSKPPLKWAWIFSLILFLVFILFNAKRKQRVVPVIKPNENTTLAFTKTIGNLYYETRDHNNIIKKKITYFLENIRNTYHLETQILDDKFMRLLSLKSGRNKEIVKNIVECIVHLRQKSNCNENDLMKLNDTIENYYNH